VDIDFDYNSHLAFVGKDFEEQHSEFVEKDFEEHLYFAFELLKFVVDFWEN